MSRCDCGPGGGCGKAVTSHALVSRDKGRYRPCAGLRDPFSPRYDLDRSSGVISRVSHDLYGRSIADTILVLPAPKGGVAAGWAVYALRATDIAPRAFVFTTVNPVFVQGAVHAGIPILHGFTDDPVSQVATGDLVQVDPATRTLTVLDRGPGHPDDRH